MPLRGASRLTDVRRARGIMLLVPDEEYQEKDVRRARGIMRDGYSRAPGNIVWFSLPYMAVVRMSQYV
jgi:hypothetical protein